MTHASRHRRNDQTVDGRLLALGAGFVAGELAVKYDVSLRRAEEYGWILMTIGTVLYLVWFYDRDGNSATDREALKGYQRHT
jgi:hypothetical protein